jgi:hypothetical protein
VLRLCTSGIQRRDSILCSLSIFIRGLITAQGCETMRRHVVSVENNPPQRNFLGFPLASLYLDRNNSSVGTAHRHPPHKVHEICVSELSKGSQECNARSSIHVSNRAAASFTLMPPGTGSDLSPAQYSASNVLRLAYGPLGRSCGSPSASRNSKGIVKVV